MQKKIIAILLVIVIAIALIISAKPMMKLMYKTEYSEYVEKYSKEYNVDKYLIYAVIKNESKFDNEATSNKNAKGLMQIMDETGKEIANKLNIENELYDEETNIQLGVFYLYELMKKYGSELLAIAAYNAGLGNVDSWIEKGIIKPDASDIENIPIKETNNYVRKISRDYKIYKELYEEI